MRAGFLTDAKEIGGSEVWLAEVLPRLRTHGVEPLAAFPQGGKTGPIVQKLEDAGVPVVRYQSYQELPQVDLWISSAWFPTNFRQMLKALPRPHYALVHDQVEIYYPLGLHRLYRLGYRTLKAPLLRQADGVITVSRWAAEFLAKVHRVPNVRYVKNGVDTKRFRPPEPGEKEALKKKFGLDGVVALLPARFAVSLEKNQITALLVARAIPNLTLAFAGEGPLLGATRKLARLLGARNVRFLGRVSNMPELYRAADIFFFPTLGENQSLATLEAMASGLPVLTSDIPAQRELLENRREGLLVPPKVREMAKALANLAAYPEWRAKMGLAARSKVVAEHQLDKTIEQLAALLQQIAFAPSKA